MSVAAEWQLAFFLGSDAKLAVPQNSLYGKWCNSHLLCPLTHEAVVVRLTHTAEYDHSKELGIC